MEDLNYVDDHICYLILSINYKSHYRMQINSATTEPE